MSIQVSRIMIEVDRKVVDPEIATSSIKAQVKGRKPKRKSKVIGALAGYTDRSDLSSLLTSDRRDDGESE